MLLYAKWSRGYRQGGVASFAADKLQDYQAEHVDTYEVGAKTSWRGALPGHFNIAGYYNNFRNQQIQLGVQCIPVSACSQTTAILNVGKSRLSGFEAELGVNPFSALSLMVSWSHLRTRIKEVNGSTDYATAAASISAQVSGLGLPFNDLRPPLPGSVLPNSIPDKVVANATLTLPIPASAGKLTIGGTMVYQSSYRAVADNATTSFTPAFYNSLVANTSAVSTVGNGILPAVTYGNINVNWENVASMPVDLGFFMTNVTNAHIFLHANTQEATGLLSNIIGEPRMYGFRLKYRFGAK